MASTKKADGEERALEQLHMRQRTALNNAYAALQGQQVADSFAAFTFEDAVDAQIELIEGKDSQQHPNQLNRTEKIRNDLARAVNELKSLPPEMFLDANMQSSVNTPEDG